MSSDESFHKFFYEQHRGNHSGRRPPSDSICSLPLAAATELSGARARPYWQPVRGVDGRRASGFLPLDYYGGLNISCHASCLPGCLHPALGWQTVDRLLLWEIPFTAIGCCGCPVDLVSCWRLSVPRLFVCFARIDVPPPFILDCAISAEVASS